MLKMSKMSKMSNFKNFNTLKISKFQKKIYNLKKHEKDGSFTSMMFLFLLHPPIIILKNIFQYYKELKISHLFNLFVILEQGISYSETLQHVNSKQRTTLNFELV